ncbi:MAG: ABC transporter ATP-binding protein [Caulobacterales bacterium]|nr:ABC transporter ATP-binding protein [Caulobacterales bacterium]
MEDLSTHFATEDGTVRAVDGLSFDIDRGETVALVGESGSGKSVTSLSIMRLLDPTAARIAGGRVLFRGEDLAQKTTAQMRAIRGNAISMIFQEPMTSLNPVYSIGEQIGEVLRVHKGTAKRTALTRACELLELVGIPEPAKRLSHSPHEMSGGMRQRVMIAMALACDPQLLIADEPTTALDVTVQAQIVELMRDLQAQTAMSILFITHDLGVVAQIADRVLVMYAGRAVEEAPVDALFSQPLMPYTSGLLQSIPRPRRNAEGPRRLPAIPGNIPSPLSRPAGCSFHPRCAHVEPACQAALPALEPVEPRHRVRCRRWRELDLGPATR